jgi:NADP-dependent 3-hydroxy acid dehydrogenase YdfG
MTDRLLEGRVAAVTGASSGIGRATAIALSRAGAAAALAAGRGERLEALAEQLDGPVTIYPRDLTDEGAARSFVAAAHADHGTLDVLVNNAGLMYVGDVLGADTADWRRMLDINLWALLVCTHEALPLIAESGGGDIVNVSSIAGRRADAGLAVYNMTKFGVHGFSEALRQEAARHRVRVTVVAPGLVDTEIMNVNTDPEVQREFQESRAALGKPLQAEDIAEAIVHAVSRPAHVGVNEIILRPAGQAR